MIERAAFRPLLFQAAAFFQNLQFSTRTVLPHLQEVVGGILDGDPVLLPIPDEAPGTIPKIILPSRNQALRFDAALARIDFRWQKTEGVEDVSLERFVELAERAEFAFCRVVNASPSRLALVVTSFQEHPEAGRAIAAHFCRDDFLANEPGRKGPLNRPGNFEIHAHKVFALRDLRVNSWVRCKTAVLTSGPAGILVEQDLNTLPVEEAPRTFTEAQIQQFHRDCIAELDSIMRLYFQR